ncbi:MAG: hypothetical protein TU35_006830 [Thermoproteus sp. AZ2]|jgi:hypothetical protein|uniref:Uncharacterized protein n=1 Tax=Thermoproteus sp. AZ2 TaxID=1609232 RepID=A0ACC6V1R6_9CREN|nr:MAG: hypothetical protein TU35_00730 [Thermoproteus sp. AZ2]
MRLLIVFVLLLAVVALAVNITIYAVDQATGKPLNATIELYSGNELVEIGFNNLTADVAPGVYIVDVLYENQVFSTVETITSSGVYPVKIPMAIIEAEAVDAVTGRPVEWPVEVRGPSSVVASGIGSVKAEVLASAGNGTPITYSIVVETPFRSIIKQVQPVPGQTSPVYILVPTAAVRVEVYNGATGNLSDYPVFLSNGTAVIAEGRGEIAAEVLAGNYTVIYTVSLGPIALNFTKTISLGQGVNETVPIRAPTAVVTIYVLNPLGAPIRNATVQVYYGVRLIANGSPPLSLILLGNATYKAVAQYGDYEASAELSPRPFQPAIYYLNLSLPTTTTRVMPITSASSTTSLTSTGARRTTTTTTATPKPTKAPSSNTSASSASAPPYLLPLAGLMPALAAVALALTLAARRGR